VEGITPVDQHSAGGRPRWRGSFKALPERRAQAPARSGAGASGSDPSAQSSTLAQNSCNFPFLVRRWRQANAFVKPRMPARPPVDQRPLPVPAAGPVRSGKEIQKIIAQSPARFPVSFLFRFCQLLRSYLTILAPSRGQGPRSLELGIAGSLEHFQRQFLARRFF